MKRALKITLYVLAFLLFAGGMGVLLVLTDQEKKRIDCKAIQVEILGECPLTTEEEIHDKLERNFHDIVGQRLYNLDLGHIEYVLSNDISILDAQAWVSADGILHIEICQREPVLKVLDSNGKGYYADDKGVVFPLSKHGDIDVPVIICDYHNIISEGWILQVLSLMEKIGKSSTLKDRVTGYSVQKNGDFILHTACESVIFGDFKDISRKMAYIDRYYARIAPLEREYKSVNVKYDKHIICRKKGI